MKTIAIIAAILFCNPALAADCSNGTCVSKPTPVRTAIYRPSRRVAKTVRAVAPRNWKARRKASCCGN